MVSDIDLKMGTESRLWDLIQERSQAGKKEVEAIDRYIWELFGEKWTVVFTDLAGFSRKTRNFGITHFIQTIFESKRLLFPVIRKHRGFLVKSEADSLMVLFRTTKSALECMIEGQKVLQNFNDRRIEEDKVHLCVGIGVGEVLRIGEHDVWGQEVNAASKLGEDTAKAGEILVTEAAYKELQGVEDLLFEELAEEVAGSDKNFRLSW